MMHPPVAFARTARLHEATPSKNGVDPRLKPAAHEFEASLMQELLKPMEKDSLFSQDNGDGMVMGDAGMDTWSSLGTQSLAKALSDAGGLGIATKMIAEVEAEAREKQDASKSDAKASVGEMSVNKGISLSAHRAHLHEWSTVRRLP